MARRRHIGVVTAGGDCPGMNAALRAVVKAAVHRHDIRVTGFLDGFAGLLADQSRPLGFDDVSGILRRVEPCSALPAATIPSGYRSMDPTGGPTRTGRTSC